MRSMPAPSTRARPIPGRSAPWRHLPILGLCLLLAAACRDEPSDALEQIEISGTEILWDEWGVPHILAESETALFRAHGWAQMQSHGDLILQLYGQARGRAAEYWGEAHLGSDRWIRTVGVPERAERWYRSQSEEFRPKLDAFVQGMNDYAEAHGDRLVDSLEVVLPIRPTDVLAHLQRATLFTFVTSPRAADLAIQRFDEKVARANENVENGSNGSNAWAIGPSRSESGNAMLLANPHLPWSDLYLFYELHLVAPEVNVYGVTLVGLPVPGIGFNDRIAWTHTVNTHDGVDYYALKLGPDGYAWADSTRQLESRQVVIRVKRSDGGVEERPFTIFSSVHGPLVAVKQGVGVAIRVVGLDRAGMGEQWWDMAKARNLRQFEGALQRLQLPTFTVMYADRDGHILHLFGGLTPVRPEGPWDWTEVVPGDRPETLWTETHPYEDLPRVLDPPAGWLQNTNDPPWTTTFPRALQAANFPSYMAPRFMHFRAQRSARMLLEDERISFDELVDYKHSTRMELADRILDDLIPAARERGTERARRAADVLERWDRRADADSRGAVLFQLWFFRLRRDAEDGSPFAVAWNPQDPLRTPDGLADPVRAVAVLDTAAARVAQAYGSMDVSWGEVYRLRLGGKDLPANGGPGELGIFRVVGYGQAPDGHYQATFGDTWVAAIEFTEEGVRARALLSYGNASQAGSPHRGDQLELFSEKRLRPIWRTRAEIEAHLSARETF